MQEKSPAFNHILEQVLNVAAEAYSVEREKITAQTRLVEFDASMETVEFVIQCEEAFNVSISDEEAQMTLTFADIAWLIESKLITGV